MLNQLRLLLVVSSVFSVVSLSAIEAKAEEVSSGEAIASDPSTTPVVAVSESESAVVDSPVISVEDINNTQSAAANPPATTVEEWQAQIAQSRVTITNVRVEETEAGLQVVLETAGGDLTTPATQTVGEALIAEIPNAVLDLPDGEVFEQFGPAEGIALVRVTELPDNRVQISITGTEAVPQAQISADAGTLVLSVVPGVAQAVEADDDAIQVVVTGEEAGSDYFVPNASSTLRTGVDIRDTPSSVQVIPQQVIRDQAATNVQEIVRNASGVNLEENGVGRGERFTLRGFRAEQFRNGFRDDTTFSSRTETELANIERVEVFKGPASILFGRAEPSGIINFVTKQPLREPFYELAFTMGSFDFTRPTIDFTGPLTADGSLAYRLNAAYENAGSFRDGVESERFFIAPTLSWEIGDDTELTLEFSYLDDTRQLDGGLFVLSDGEVADIPFSTFLGDNDSPSDFEETRTELSLDHRFNDNLSLRSLLRYTTASEDSIFIRLASAESEDGRNFPVSDLRTDQSFETFAIQNDLIAEFNTDTIDHTLLFGFEYANLSQEGLFGFRDGATVDIFNPSRDFVFPEFPPFDSFEEDIDSFGIYLQDQIALSDNLQLVIGGRFDAFNSESEFNGEVSETDAEAFSPRVGVVYRPVEPISLYASYIRSFTPVGGTNVDGESFDPQRGTGFEVGMKTDIIPGRLFSTLAFYNTTLTNVTTEDPVNPNFSVQTGEQRSRGVELDIQGEILPGWNIFAGYAYTDAEVTEDNVIPEGNRLRDVPEHNFNLWTKYTIQEGDLAGLGFGAGVFYVSERAGDLDNSFSVDSYTRVDAAISYERENYRFGLNFQNLFDSRFIVGTNGRRNIIPGAPFTILGTVSVDF